MEKQYIYIVQGSLQPSFCIIGLVENLRRRLEAFNEITDESLPKNTYRYIYICEVQDMVEVLYDIKNEFYKYKIDNTDGTYLLNNDLFTIYVEYIRSHPLFEEEMIIIKKIF